MSAYYLLIMRVLCAFKEILPSYFDEKIQYLYVINLGDLISGRIHAPLRINSRMDVVSQTQQISELVAQFLAELSRHFSKIEYYDCLDNHSRVEPIKEKRKFYVLLG